jgi:hypothetical protein
MAKLSRTASVTAPSESAFAYVDDIRHLARQMSERGSVRKQELEQTGGSQ